MADRDDTGERPGSPDDDEAVQLERVDFLVVWKKKWGVRLRMRLTDAHIAQFLGITAGTVYRKRNKKTKIKQRLVNHLTSVEGNIEANIMPPLCDDAGNFDEKLRRAILAYQIRRPRAPQ